MATSSITRNFVITGKDKVEAFANALEESATAFVSESKVSARQLTDPDEIKALMMKAKEKKGKKLCYSYTIQNAPPVSKLRNGLMRRE